MTEAEKDSLDLEISELMEPSTGLPTSQIPMQPSARRCWVAGPRKTVVRINGSRIVDRIGDTAYWSPTSWTRSEEASARLLDVLPVGTRIIKYDENDWDVYWPVQLGVEYHQNDEDRKVAIALAGKAWLGSLTPEERSALVRK